MTSILKWSQWLFNFEVKNNAFGDSIIKTELFTVLTKTLSLPIPTFILFDLILILFVEFNVKLAAPEFKYNGFVKLVLIKKVLLHISVNPTPSP